MLINDYELKMHRIKFCASCKNEKMYAIKNAEVNLQIRNSDALILTEQKKLHCNYATVVIFLAFQDRLIANYCTRVLICKVSTFMQNTDH